MSIAVLIMLLSSDLHHVIMYVSVAVIVMLTCITVALLIMVAVISFLIFRYRSVYSHLHQFHLDTTPYVSVPALATCGRVGHSVLLVVDSRMMQKYTQGRKGL